MFLMITSQLPHDTAAHFKVQSMREIKARRLPRFCFAKRFSICGLTTFYFLKKFTKPAKLFLIAV